MLTVAGGSFPNRVAVSLYESLILSPTTINKIKNDYNIDLEHVITSLVTYSAKEFEDNAIKLVTKTKSRNIILDLVKYSLEISNFRKIGIFSSKKCSSIFYYSMQSVFETSFLNRTKYNIVLPDSSFY